MKTVKGIISVKLEPELPLNEETAPRWQAVPNVSDFFYRVLPDGRTQLTGCFREGELSGRVFHKIWQALRQQCVFPAGSQELLRPREVQSKVQSKVQKSALSRRLETVPVLRGAINDKGKQGLLKPQSSLRGQEEAEGYGREDLSA